MKKHNIIFMITILIAIFSSFSCTKVRAGNVGIKFYLLGKSKGVDTEVLGPGKYHIGINEELYIFPTFQQNYVWTKDKKEGSPNDESFTFQTKEGMNCSADVGISYHLEPEKIPGIFQKYRKGIDEITDIFMRNNVRDAFNSIASRYAVESVYGEGKTKLMSEIKKYVQSKLEPQGIMIDNIYWIGSVRLPENVIAALNLKIAATQKAQQQENELRGAEAEAKKKVAEANGEAKSLEALAKGKARANHLLNASITPNLIKWEELEQRKKAIGKWNGILPTTMIPGSAVPFINIK